MTGERERGTQFFGEVLGEAQEAGLRTHLGSDDFGRECATWAADFAFGTIWTREGLDRRARSCVVLGMLMALRQTEEIKHHVRVALANGVAVAELQEILYMSVPYAGFPAANTAKHAMIEALRDIELEGAASR